MEVLNAVLDIQPEEWIKMPASSYINSRYLLIDVSQYSTEWYHVVQSFGSLQNKIVTVRRVQNPVQFGLFKIQREVKINENFLDPTTTVGYHIIHPKDLDIAMQYPLDYRRYSHKHLSIQSDINKQPKFYQDVETAYNQGHLSLSCDEQVIIIKCEHFLETKNQGDYYPLYVILLES